jgi:nucleotide-binding universal stress UspA family protein
MKTILVPVGGAETDQAVFATALEAARPLGAHLEFLHLRVAPGQAAVYTPHVDFAQGAALRDAISRLEVEAEKRSTVAARHFRQFCEHHGVVVTDIPSRTRSMSAVWREELNDAVERLTYRARHNDLVVLGRASRANGLPPDLIERLLLDCGRPVLIAPAEAPDNLTDTILVCWKETGEAARALTAALPLLSHGKRVVVVSVEEAKATLASAFDIAEQLRWHGIAAEATCVTGEGQSVGELLQLAARRYDATLLVMGGYGFSRAREIIFGGCTQSFIDHAERPVLLVH